MTETEWALYWATESWLEKDVPAMVGITDAAACTRIWAEVDRVRRLFQAGAESLPDAP
jgi:hypothetical protein